MRTLSQLSFVLLATFLVTFVFVPIIPLAGCGLFPVPEWALFEPLPGGSAARLEMVLK